MTAGIIGASRDNGIGVAGVVDGRTVCWLIARVFVNTDALAIMSNVIDGIEWAADLGADVINLSLGGLSYSETEERYYQDLRSRGIITVAASGNTGGTEKFYPASYSTVLSVAAVDYSNSHADFSQHNDAVNLAAPGVGILSTSLTSSSSGSSLYPSNVLFLNVDSLAVIGYRMIRSGTVADGLSGVLLDCGSGQEICPGSSSGDRHICLIERYVFVLACPLRIKDTSLIAPRL